MRIELSSAGVAWPAFALAGLIWLMSVAYGFQYLVVSDKASHFAYFRAATIPYAGLVVLLTWYAARRVGPALDVLQSPRWLGFVMGAVSWGLTCYFYSSTVMPLRWWAIASAVPLLACIAHLKWGYRGANAVFLAGAFALLIFLITRLPHDASGDMLQIISFASNDLLRGANPFQPYLTVSGKEVPFGYWPGVWLPYVPLVALGIDMRVLNLCVLGLLVLLFAKAAGAGERAASILAITLFPFLLSSLVLQMVVFGHLWVYWLLVSATVLLAATRRFIPAAILFGVCLASRPTVLFIAGPLLAYVWSRESFRVSLSSSAIALAVAVAINAPFALIYGRDFFANSYGNLAGIGQELTHFSLAGVLQAAGMGSWGRPMQALIAVASFAFVALRKSLPASQFIMFCGLTYVWQVLFASYATRYIYFPGFFLIALGLTVAYSHNNERDRSASARAAT